MSDTCKSCGAPIIWAITVNEKRMPVDATPADDGNLTLVPRPNSKEIDVRVIKKNAVYNGPRHKSHHWTCPQGRSWRK